ncbi:MAG TPA: tetratricopeptide repeat protein [Pyrinomonadaceae bacterium]|nr:tetratricopeptide repeat protein [Pyrinomonadaceae bacterium]
MKREDYDIYEFGPFRLDPVERVLLREGVAVQLAPKVLDTLVLLVRNSGHTLEKQEMLSALWPDSFVEESSLAQNIFQLRKVLRAPDGRQYIETVSKSGYRFVAEVRLLRGGGRGDAPPARADLRRHAGHGPTPKTLAVLPFKQLNSRTGDDGLLTLGMADAVVVRLSDLRELTVVPTSTVVTYAGRGHDPLTVGRKLGVDVVLDGTMQHSGERVRVTVQLVGVAGGRVLWSGKFDGQFSDLFALQDSISAQVARALALRLAGEGQPGLLRRPTESVEAYQYYVKGRFFWDKRTEATLRKSIEYFRRATELDPDYALAHAGLADSYSLLGEYLFIPPQEAFVRAKAAALRALEIDAGLADAHVSLAEVLFFYERDWEAAEDEFQRAFELNPNHAVARHMYAWFLLTQERSDEAAEEFRRARALDPMSLIYNTAVGMPFYYERQYNRAAKIYRDALEMDQNFTFANYYLGSALLHKGDREEALAEFRKVREDGHVIPQASALIGYTYAVMGRRDAARDELKKLSALSSRRYVSPYNFALVYSGLGEVERVYEWLDRAYREHANWLVFLNIDPGFDHLRSSPRFTRFLERLGFSAARRRQPTAYEDARAFDLS